MGAGGDFEVVPLQGAYVARLCPVAPQLKYDTSLEVVPVPPTAAEQARADAGLEYERLVFDTLVSLHGDSVANVEGGGRGELQAATVAAMESGASLVLGGWLPDDVDGRRTGRPDILIRKHDGWIPADVKHHGVTESAEEGSEAYSELAYPLPVHASSIPGAKFNSNALGDALQLAHYWRLLDSAELAATDPIGGIIGRDGRLWWFDLTEVRWRRNTISALALYDREFQLRLEVIARQLHHNVDSSLSKLVIPLRKRECPSCGWRQVCGQQLAEVDSISLLPGVRWPNALQFIRNGITSRTELAQLDWETAWVMHGDAPGSTVVNVAEILARSAKVEPTTPLTDVLGRAKRTRLVRLAELGMTCVGDLARLDRTTGKLSGLGAGYLPGMIDQARAAVSGGVFLARGQSQLEVLRADVEVDVDMENADSGVYLWGARISRNTLTGEPATYRPFVSWVPVDEMVEAEVFATFWGWLMALRDWTVARGRTFAAYCYSSAENTQMRRIAELDSIGPSQDEVNSFIKSPEWVDLHAVAKSQLITGGNLGLKQVAPLAGFHWRDEDPGGDQSTVWYQRAVGHLDPKMRAASQERLLQYNQDDVAATASVRDWLCDSAFPPIAAYLPDSEP